VLQATVTEAQLGDVGIEAANIVLAVFGRSDPQQLFPEAEEVIIDAMGADHPHPCPPQQKLLKAPNFLQCQITMSQLQDTWERLEVVDIGHIDNNPLAILLIPPIQLHLSEALTKLPVLLTLLHRPWWESGCSNTSEDASHLVFQKQTV
jgi:hypothetical protein